MVLEGLAARYAARNATKADVAELRAILKEMRALLDDGDLLGASGLNARLHARLLEIARHGTVSRLVATLSSQLVRFQYRTILAARPRGAVPRGAPRDRRRRRRRRPGRRRAGRSGHTLATSSRRFASSACRRVGRLAEPRRIVRMSETNSDIHVAERRPVTDVAVHDLAHLSHVELLTPKPEESLFYFREILGMEVSGESGDSVYLRGFGDYERSTAEVDGGRAGRGRAHRLPDAEPRGPRAPGRRARGGRGAGRVARR